MRVGEVSVCRWIVKSLRLTAKAHNFEVEKWSWAVHKADGSARRAKARLGRVFGELEMKQEEDEQM